MLSPSLLVAAYEAGYFPMAMDDGALRWYSPDPRGILPLDRFHTPRRLQRIVRSRRFEVTVNKAFRDVVAGCAGDREEGTWINSEIIDGCCALYDRRLAHSVEVWQGTELAGGLYGVALRGAFFGESMFHRVSDASKVALFALVMRLRARGFRLLDIQWLTPFLASCGATDIPREEYLDRLQDALQADVRFED